MIFFLTFKREDRLVFASEVCAPNFYAALNRAREAMMRTGVATGKDFASGRVRPTHIGEMPDGVRAPGVRKEYGPGGPR